MDISDNKWLTHRPGPDRSHDPALEWAHDLQRSFQRLVSAQAVWPLREFGWPIGDQRTIAR